MKKIFGLILIFPTLILLAGCGTALTRAAGEGDIADIQKLLDRGADINEDATLGGVIAGSPLSYAAYHCRIEAVKYLIHKGADINNATGYADYGDSGGGLRPLHMAASSGCTEVIKLLLDAGADIDVRANERRGAALAMAAYAGHSKSVKYLLERGADVDDAIEFLERSGGDGKRGLALIRKSVEPKISVKAQEKTPVLTAIKSDVDELPSINAKPQKNSFAIVIGIENYRQKLPHADHAVNDAKVVTEYLTKVMGFPEGNVVTLTNDHASLTDFIKYFEKWLPNNIEKDSTVFIYFSGHGAPNVKTGDAYLVPYDGDPSFIEQTGYPLNRLYESLNKLQAKEIIVALDSCFSGAGGKSVIAQGARPLVMNLEQDIQLSRNMIVMTASSGDQISSTYAEKGHGLFTYFLLKGIKDGITEVGELFDYLKPNVGRTARKVYNNEQTPQLIAPDKQKVFLRN
jgi:ankyrin repeat protein